MEDEEATSENIAFSIALLEGVYRRGGDDPRTVELLGTLYTEAGMYGKGLEMDLHHIALEPANPSAHYNCACSYSLLGRLDEAFAQLREALGLGFDNIAWMMKDSDLDPVRVDPRWAELTGKVGATGEETKK